LSAPAAYEALAGPSACAEPFHAHPSPSSMSSSCIGTRVVASWTARSHSSVASATANARRHFVTMREGSQLRSCFA
jgi:hypothetical protein